MHIYIYTTYDIYAVLAYSHTYIYTTYIHIQLTSFIAQ